jgi:hypothetical protein
MARISPTLLYNLAFLLSTVSISCSEVLPPRDDPTNVLVGHMEVEYSFGVNINGIVLWGTVFNKYDESLSGQAAISGILEFTPAGRPEQTIVRNFTKANLRYAKSYNVATGELVIDPGDSITVRYYLELASDSVRAPWSTSLVPLLDWTCLRGDYYQRSISNPVTIEVTAHLLVFDQTGPVNLGFRSTTFCFVDRWVDPVICRIPPTQPPCGAPPWPW